MLQLLSYPCTHCSHGPPKSCCLFDCAPIKALFASAFPTPAQGVSAERIRSFEPVHSISRPFLNESVLSDEPDALPISSELMSTVRDVASLNKELVRALDSISSARVKVVLDLGANPNHQPSSRKETLLMTACYNSDTDSVKYLLNAQADPNQKPAGEDQVTPLMIAAENGMTEAVTELLAHMADPHVRNANGETALLAAARTNNHDTFAVLVGSMVSG